MTLQAVSAGTHQARDTGIGGKLAIYKANLSIGSNLSQKAKQIVLRYDAARAPARTIPYHKGQKRASRTPHIHGRACQ
jgi:hypothetical protein